jgi:iron complex outermembrane receptor protein
LSHCAESACHALRRVAPAGLAILAAAAPLAAAQPSLDEVVITSTRVEQRAFDVPAAVDSVRVVERPDALGISASEYLGAVAGLLVRDRRPTRRSSRSRSALRARAQFGTSASPMSTAYQTMMDGQPGLNFTRPRTPEILRGPFGVVLNAPAASCSCSRQRAGP